METESAWRTQFHLEQPARGFLCWNGPKVEQVMKFSYCHIFTVEMIAELALVFLKATMHKCVLSILYVSFLMASLIRGKQKKIFTIPLAPHILFLSFEWSMWCLLRILMICSQHWSCWSLRCDPLHPPPFLFQKQTEQQKTASLPNGLC